MKKNVSTKISWQGEIVSIQPRTTVWRYVLDNRTHSHIGYNLFLDGNVNGISGKYSIAISEKQQQKNQFHIGDVLSGTAWTKIYAVTDYADYYRAGTLRRIMTTESADSASSPPWKIAPPDLNTYSDRGARILSVSCWRSKCFQCVWANMAAVEIEYNWAVTKKYRFESFCYGPKSCKFYKMGSPRQVSYKGRGVFYDDGWLDEICTERRGYDE